MPCHSAADSRFHRFCTREFAAFASLTLALAASAPPAALYSLTRGCVSTPSMLQTPRYLTQSTSPKRRCDVALVVRARAWKIGRTRRHAPQYGL